MSLSKIIVKKFRNEFENKCFNLIVNAYNTSITEKIIQLDWNENDISSELQEKMKLNPLRKKWRILTQVEFHIPKKVIKTKGFADKFPRIDFSFTSFGIINEYEYYFEAKNLKENSTTLIKRYINTGIDNFIVGKYSNGSLLGYLLDGDLSNTIAGINLSLKNDQRNTEILTPKQNKYHKNFYESMHDEIGILKHLVFDFTKIIEK